MSARATGGVGVVSFALIATAGLIEPLWNMPSTTATGAQIASYVARNRDGFIGSVTVYAVAMSLFLVFAVGVWAVIRRIPGTSRTGALVFMAGSVALTTLVLAGFVAALVLAYRAPDVAAPRELYDLCFGLLAMSGAPTAVALAAYAGIAFRTPALPAPTAWLAALGAAAHVVILFSFIPRSGFFSLEGGVIVAIPLTLFAWLLATGVALLLGGAERDPTP